MRVKIGSKIEGFFMLFEKFFMPLCIVIFSSLCSHTYATEQAVNPPHTKWVTVSNIKQSLAKQKPVNVGFDIDDTILFTTPAFAQAIEKFCPDLVMTPNKAEYHTCISSQQFWDYTNKHDENDIPKKVAKELIALHLARGDNIYFITMRAKSSGETLTNVIKQDFGLKAVNPVIFLGDLKDFHKKAPKASKIKELNIKIYYGDSDLDIESAQVAHARGIRIMRSAKSHDQPLPLNGRFGEEVVVGSDV